VVVRELFRALCFFLQGYVLIFWQNVDSYQFLQISGTQYVIFLEKAGPELFKILIIM
jgi:hypothetical protein